VELGQFASLADIPFPKLSNFVKTQKITTNPKRHFSSRFTDDKQKIAITFNFSVSPKTEIFSTS